MAESKRKSKVHPDGLNDLAVMPYLITNGKL